VSGKTPAFTSPERRGRRPDAQSTPNSQLVQSTTGSGFVVSANK
jgi:hypothetical protein